MDTTATGNKTFIQRLLKAFFDLSIYQKFALILANFLLGFLILSGFHLYYSLVGKKALLAVENIENNPPVQQALYLIENSITNGAILVGVLMAFVIITTLFSAKKLVDFLAQMQDRLEALHTHRQAPNNSELLTTTPVVSNDEIGKIAHIVNSIISDNHAVVRFRRTIEADETTTEVYNRLSYLFKNKLSLQRYIIWDTIEQTNELKRIMAHPEDLGEQSCQLNIVNDCRACRTGSIVSSVHRRNICPVFPMEKTATHTCVPLITGGVVIGVVQFLSQFTDKPEHVIEFDNQINMAKYYLQETIPVLHAKRLTGYLRNLTIRDGMTGLYNRRFLKGNTAHLIASVNRRKSAMSLIMCDMDFFKQVNDDYSHKVGDDVLIQLGSLLLDSIRESDIAIRYGGEEFLLLLIDCKKDKGVEVAEKIRKKIEAYDFQSEGNHLNKTISLGVSEFPKDSTDFWECIKYADVALYQAKEKGRNRTVIFQQEMKKAKGY